MGYYREDLPCLGTFGSGAIVKITPCTVLSVAFSSSLVASVSPSHFDQLVSLRMAGIRVGIILHYFFLRMSSLAVRVTIKHASIGCGRSAISKRRQTNAKPRGRPS